MKINFNVTITLSDEGVEAWSEEYKIYDENGRVSKRLVAEDIKNHLYNNLQADFSADLTNWTVERNS